MRELKILDFENNKIRIFKDANGKQWFAGRDVSKAAGYSNSSVAMKSHCKEPVTYIPVEYPSGIYNTRIISLTDVHRLAISGKRPEALRFEQWMQDIGLIEYHEI